MKYQATEEKNALVDLVIIGKGVVFSGSITTKGLAVISGTYKGELTAQTVQVKRTGEITGHVAAEILEVSGKIVQKVTSTKYLHIDATGSIAGALDYREMNMARGAQINGTVKRRT